MDDLGKIKIIFEKVMLYHFYTYCLTINYLTTVSRNSAL